MEKTNRSTPNRAGYSIREFSAAYGVCLQTTYNLINAGRIKSFKIGRRRIIPASEIDRLQDEAT